MSLVASADALLRAHPYAGGTREAIVALLEACTERVLAPGEVLCREKTHGDEAWVLVAGQIEVLRSDAAGVEHRLAILDAPTLLGHLSLIDTAARSATLRAHGPATVRCVTRATWVRLSNAATPVGTALRRLLLSALYQQLSRAHQQVVGGSEAEKKIVFDGFDMDELVD